MMWSDRCCESLRDSVVQCEENGKRFRIKNPGRRPIQKCIVDGCMLAGAQRRCDFLFQIEDSTIYLVELKGVEHVHALRQIIAAAEALKISSFDGRKRSVIVGAPSPKASTAYQIELKKLSKKFKTIGLSYPIRKNNIVEVSAE